jgi:hypothetical protein
MDRTSSFLFARPSVWEGVARIIDFGNTLNEYNYSPKADDIALRIDWLIVGDDLRKAIGHYAEEATKATRAAVRR